MTSVQSSSRDTMITLLERWPAYPAPEESEKWFYDWVLTAPRRVSRHLTAGWHAYRILFDALVATGTRLPTRYVDYFGGLGGQSLIVRHQLALRGSGLVQHTIHEISPQAVLHLNTVIPTATVRLTSAYGPRVALPGRHGLAGLDYDTFTVWRLKPGQPQYELLRRVVASGAVGFVLTDVAGMRLGINGHKYERLLGPGTCRGYLTYLAALAERISVLTGYSFVGGYQQRWAAVGAWMAPPLPPDYTRWRAIPASPVGLQIGALSYE